MAEDSEFDFCDECGATFPEDELFDGLCDDCQDADLVPLDADDELLEPEA